MPRFAQRVSIAIHVVFAAEREDALLCECQQIREETDALRMDSAARLASALEEEASAARTARCALTKENSELRLQVEAKDSNIRLLHAELGALRALNGIPSSLGIRPEAALDSCMIPMGDGTIDKVSQHMTIPAFPLVDEQGETMSLTSPRGRRYMRKKTHSRLQKQGSPRRLLEFVARDFVPKGDALPPWRAEVAATFAWWKHVEQVAQQHDRSCQESAMETKVPHAPSPESFTQQQERETIRIRVSSGGG